eukprot:8629590-Ditylum_brightwellii.AAC.1
MSAGGFSNFLDPQGSGKSTVDTISISTTCGDGVLDPMETCDTNEFGTKTCSDYGFIGGGTLSCRSDLCTIMTDDCNGGCGNNVKEADEVCDGLDISDKTCADAGFTTGELGCHLDCGSYDTTQ